MNDAGQEANNEAARFFSVKQQDEKRDSVGSNSLAGSVESDDRETKGCLTLRVVQFLLPCLRKKGVWEPSQGDVFKSQDAEETKYPRTLKILENKIFDVIFVLSCILSIFLFLFSEGFLIESRLLWGIIHLVNAVYAIGLFSQWLQILIKSKYAKTNHGYTTWDIIYTLLSVFPADLIVLAIYTLNDEDDNDDDDQEANPIELWMITLSRLNYLLRIRSISQYFSKWEDQLVVGDFRMFMLRTLLSATFLLHAFACIWHRIACDSFMVKHFSMTPDEATVELCDSDPNRKTWMGLLYQDHRVPLLDHPGWHVLLTHYLVSVYWTVVAMFRMGASDIRTSLISDVEVAFVSITEMVAWIFILVFLNGTLASLLIEKDTERQNFITRCFAIRHFLQFGRISRSIQDDVTRFYNYLWEKSSGILNLDLVDAMPHAMKSEVFYDVNKFVLDQLPILKGLETPFLMSLSVRTNHRFYMSGEYLFRRNEIANAMYYLVKGHLEVLSDDEKHPITSIRSGSVIGEMHLLQPYPHVATVRCGSDCEIRMLSRKHFKQVLNIYPQYEPVLEQRLENRLEQCGLLLALCEKHNTYHKAFKALADYSMEHDDGIIGLEHAELTHSFENVTKILTPDVYENIIRTARDSDDYDAISIKTELDGYAKGEAEQRETKKCYEEMLAAALEALEADVARAVSLANDLNIPRPPLIVTAPETSTHLTVFKKQPDAENVFVIAFRRLKETEKGKWDFAWKLLVTCCALAVFWFYPYQFAFRSKETIILNYVFHLTDFFFILDCVYDMIQVVITPQKTFESVREITIYRIKTFYFWFRIFCVIPFEYIYFIVVKEAQLTPYFYLCKINRLFLIHVAFRFMGEFERKLNFNPVMMIMAKFLLTLFLVTHIFAVLYKYVQRDLNSVTDVGYRHSFYWAIVVCTALGYGDFPSQTSIEVLVEVLGLIIGVSTLIYMQARVTATLVNSERKRMFFKQAFYSLQTFMKEKRFPKSLWNRVCNYYRLQWRVHEGTLIPSGRSAIWDAPKSLITKVAYSHAYRYISRIPLFNHAPVYLQNEMCVGLKHYVLPPGEVVLHPEDLSRDLYIISKGYVEVVYEGVRIGVFTEGRYFGLNGLIFGVHTNFMFRTITHCQLFCLTHDNFAKIAYTNTNFMRELEIIIGKRTSFRPKDTSSVKSSTFSEYPNDQFLRELVENGKPTQIITEVEEPTPTYVTWFRAIPSNMGKKFKDIGKNPFFLPHGKGLRWWTTFRLTIAVLATIFAPAQAAFPIDPTTSFGVTLAFDLIAWIDIIVSMRIAYFGSENQLVTSTKKMITHYLKGPFLIDILASFPGDLIAFIILRPHANYNNMYHLISLLRLNRMLQCYRILLVNGMLEKAIARRLSLVMLLEMAPVMFLFLNLTTCLSVLRVCGVSKDGKPQKCFKDAWILKGLEQLDYTTPPAPPSYHLQNAMRTYIIGLYWVTQSVMSVGYGDIEIGEDYANQMVATMVIIFGILVSSYCGSKLTSCIIGEDPAKIELQEKMKLMNSYLEEQRSSRSVRKRVRETYLNAWDKTKGVNPNTLFVSLPPTLRSDVMRQLYGPTLRSSQLFEDLDGPGLRMLASSLSEIFYPEGEFLMKFGDLCNDIFFIAQGAVVCYNVRGTIMSHMGSGSIIGEISPIFHTHRLYTTIAVKDVNAYVFKKDAFMNFLDQYPDIRSAMEIASVKHYREAMKGSKKNELGGDSDVLLNIQNEKKLGVEISNDTFFGLKANDKPYTHDPTRNVLQEDLLKSPEDFSKATRAKWWSVIVTFGRMARDDMGLVHVYQELGQCNIFNFTIHPASSVCNWVSFCLALTAVSCSITAYEIAFAEVEESLERKGLIGFRDVLEIFYIIRLIGNFHLGYYDETSALITDVKKITRRYIRKIDGFWLDAITTFPFYLINHIPGLESSYIRGIQLLRVCLFVRYLNETESRLKMKASRVKIIKITILLCFIFHFCACAWYLVACYDAYCTVGSWMDKTLNDLYVSGGIDPNQVSIASRYLLALYYVTNALTFVGFPDISPRTNIELVITISMIVGTVFVIGYLVGEMAQCLASQVATKIHYQHKLSVLENHFNILGISPAKIAEVRHHFKLLWCRCKGAMLFHLMEELPYSLRADVAMEIYGTNIKSSRILGKLDDNLIRQLSARIHQEIYFPGSHIVQAGDVCTSMYFIKKGEVVILDGSSNLELCVEILYENECFGEVKILLPREQYRFSYRARLETEVGVLHQDDLEAVLKNHPRIYDELKEKANRIKVRRMSLRETEEAVHKIASTSSMKTLLHPSTPSAEKDKSPTNSKT